MSKYSILKEFNYWDTDLIQQMHDCQHKYDNHNLNPYHLEGSVLTHTYMVYKVALDNLSLLDSGEDRLIMQICALCHDIGKVYCRTENPEKKRVSFFGHAENSIQDSVDFMYHLEERGYFEGLDTTYIFYYVTAVISNHMRYVQSKTYSKDVAEKDSKLSYLSSFFLMCDTEGSFCENT